MFHVMWWYPANFFVPLLIIDWLLTRRVLRRSWHAWLVEIVAWMLVSCGLAEVVDIGLTVHTMIGLGIADPDLQMVVDGGDLGLFKGSVQHIGSLANALTLLGVGVAGQLYASRSATAVA